MTHDEIALVNELAGKRGDLEKGALKFLGLETKAGSECAVNGIIEEVRQYNEADDETRAGIEAYKAAKENVESEDISEAEDSTQADGGETADGGSDENE